MSVLVCRYLVIDFGTSKSPKSTRQRDSHSCPGRPASVPLRHAIASLGAGYAALLQMAGRRVRCACIWPTKATGLAAPSPLRPYARADAYRGLRAFASLSSATRGRTRIYQGN